MAPALCEKQISLVCICTSGARGASLFYVAVAVIFFLFYTCFQGFDDKEARDRTPVEMCVVDLIAKIKNAANGQRRPLYTDLQDYTSFGALDGLASQMTGQGSGGGASAAAMSLLMSSRSWFDMPLKFGFSWFWPRLVSSLDDEAEMNQVFTRVKSFLERHGESLGSTSRVQILVLIMLLREFITLRPTADVNWLCATIEVWNKLAVANLSPPF